MKVCVLSVFLLSCLFLESCNKDKPEPKPGNFYFKSLTVDGVGYRSSFSGAAVSPSIVISFNARIDHPTAESLIILSGGAGNLPLNFNYSNNDSTVTIAPVTPLKYWNTYFFQIPQGVKSSTGGTFSPAVSIKIITGIDPADKFPRISDDALLDTVQKKTLRYFYEFGHEASGMARERDNAGNTVTTGGSGFGIMAMVAGIERGFIPRDAGVARFNKIVTFLEKADRFHGAWPHWIDGSTGKVIPFSTNDNGADLVETSFMAEGLITMRQYLKSSDTTGNNLIKRITKLYNDIEWDWFRQEDQKNVLYWHWSPNKAWIMNFALSGYFEEQITYFMAACSPTHGIPKIVYTNGFGQNGGIVTNKTWTYNNDPVLLPLGSPSPLFWVQYSYLGLNPHFKDDFADYWVQNTAASKINFNYCVQNPHHYAGYSAECWGLTASDNEDGYDAQSPDNDNGTITPTAALSSFPYTPVESMAALKFFYYKLGDKLVGKYGFYDAFDVSTAWAARSTLAIDQGPIVVMIENYRSQLLWNLFMSAPEVQQGYTTLGFHQ